MSSDRVSTAIADALFVQPTEERRARLRESASGVAFGNVWHRLESHGVLPIVHKNLCLAGVKLTADDDALVRPRLEILKRDAIATRLTVEGLVRAMRKEGLDVILLKGASLAQDIYPEPGLRSQGDVDVLVRPKDVARAVSILGRIGLFAHEESLPAWWYRWSHFHLKLTPAVPLLKEVEVHWHLHGPSLLTTVNVESLWDRCVPSREGPPIFHLDAADRFLHLVTHLASHGLGDVPENFEDALRRGLESEAPAIRFKWWLDVVAVADRIHDVVAPEALLSRAREWNVENTLDRIAGVLATSRLPQPRAQDWFREFWRSSMPSFVPVSAVEGERPMRGFDVRWSAVRTTLPGWVFPDKSYLARRYGDVAGVFVMRLVHAASVVGFLGLSALLLPVAWIGRVALRRRRSTRRREWSTPDRVLDLIVAGRESRESA